MDMPGDELMGSSKSNNARKSAPSAVTPSPPSSRRSSSGSLPPPSNAFVHTSSSERWSQYERDDKLEENSARAHANAVASAAERAASLDTDSYSASSSRRSSSNSAYQDLPPHERVRAEALAVLEKAGDDVSPYELRQTRSGGLTSGSKQPYSFRRSASTADAGTRGSSTRADPASFRSEVSTERTRRTRAPAALAGLDLKASTPSRSNDARATWTISDDDDLGLDDEEDLVEVVDMEHRITGGRSNSSPQRSSGGGYRDYPSQQANASPSNWSSRYSVNPYLSGGVTQVDREEQRNAKSARNMFMSSTPSSSSSPVSTNIFGSGFTFRKTNLPPARDANLKTVWSDGDPLTDNGNSLDPPFYVGTNGVAKLRRRRRICVFSTLFALVMIAVIASTSKKARDRKSAPSSVVNGGGSSGGDGTTFYVMADVPYDADEGTKLSRDLQALPGDADFVIHLGNIQDSTVNLCSEYGYEEAAAILQGSPAPVFMLPGEHDWNNCPDPNKAWENWSTNFMKFERHFSPPFTVLRQSDQIENFSFLHDGVLFLGLHLVGGRVPDQDDWDDLLQANVDWVDENFNSIFKAADYRAVVLLGNARPSTQQRGFFNEIVQVVRTNGKPMIYIHANPEGGSKFAMYKPFGGAGNLDAVQLEDGGLSPPLRVSVGTGSQPFAIG